MPDFQDFSSPVWPRRDWASKEKEGTFWVIGGMLDIPPASYLETTLYQVPEGVRYFHNDTSFTSSIRGGVTLHVFGRISFLLSYTEAYEVHNFAPTSPFPVESGEIVKARFNNFDIISGNAYLSVSAFREPASRPQTPKSDDPEERYRLIDYNRCRIYIIENNHFSAFFSKEGEKKTNYLRVKNLGTKSQKVLAKRKFSLDKSQKLMDSTDYAKTKKGLCHLP